MRSRRAGDSSSFDPPAADREAIDLDDGFAAAQWWAADLSLDDRLHIDDLKAIAADFELDLHGTRRLMVWLLDGGIEVILDEEDSAEAIFDESDGWDPDPWDWLAVEFHHRLLSAQEEMELAECIEVGAAAMEKLRTIRVQSASQMGDSIDLDELRLLRRRAMRGESAREFLVVHNLRLVRYFASRRSQSSIGRLEHRDLVIEGCLGLMHAAEKFDRHRGNRFATYAAWWIRQAMSRAIANDGRIIRLPVHVVERLRQIDRETVRLDERRDRHAMSDAEIRDEIAVLLELTVEEVRRLVEWSNDAELVGNLHDLEQRSGAMIHQDLEDSVSGGTAAGDRRKVIDIVRQALTEREMEILFRRNGFGHGELETLDAIGRDLRLTRERIRQIETKAIKKIRESKWGPELAAMIDSDFYDRARKSMGKETFEGVE